MNSDKPPLLIVDAFADAPFSGNPAAVCLLDAEREPAWMQSVAGEMNLSETAFIVPVGDAFSLRWFTPRKEVELCGHATLAAAHALWELGACSRETSIGFDTLGGRLVARRRGELISLDFPATPAAPVTPPAGLAEAVGVRPIFVGRSKFDFLIETANEEEVRGATPDFSALAGLAPRGVILTSRASGPEVDFVSRFFAPAVGIDEDPVTGSAHCCLGPYWSERLGRRELTGRQVSARGGTVHATVADDRVLLAGAARTVVRGELSA